ncbi:hypothetical protein B382_03445 [Stutzerimonas stutzeri B1SMN1]|nr:hypothetical protein B382_03445 [Stutzerimonas stutzeri B1SMN1]
MERLVHIDALRGGASILLIVHVVALPALTEPGSSPAIDLWLVATLWLLFGCGFLVPAALHAGGNDGRGFAIRRLLPVYLLAVLLTAVLLPSLPAWLPGVTSRYPGMAFEAVSAYGALPPLLLFYGLCLLLHALGLLHSVSLRAGCALVLLAAALLLALTQQLIDRTLPVTLPLVLSLMFFASLRYEVQHETSSYARRRAREYARYTLRVYLLVLPVIFVAGWARDGSAQQAAWPGQLLGYAVAVALFLLFTGRLRLRAPLLIWFGSLSCSLYLLLPAMQRLGQLLTQTLGLNGPLAASASAVLGLALAITAALLCRLLEHPLTRAGNRLTGQRGVLPLGRLHSR